MAERIDIDAVAGFMEMALAALRQDGMLDELPDAINSKNMMPADPKGLSFYDGVIFTAGVSLSIVADSNKKYKVIDGLVKGEKSDADVSHLLTVLLRSVLGLANGAVHAQVDTITADKNAGN